MKFIVCIFSLVIIMGTGSHEGFAQQGITSPEVELILQEIRDIRKDIQELRGDMNQRFESYQIFPLLV